MEKKAKEKRFLVFLTSGFPYGTGETFIENEIPYLANSFEKVFILVPACVVNQEKRPVPKNTSIIPIASDFGWFYRIETFFSVDFWQGLLIDLRRKNRQTGFFNVFRNCWHYFAKALKVKKALKNVMVRKGLKFEDTIIYSYWLDDKALGAALVKKENSIIKTVSRAHRWDIYEEMHPVPFLPFRPWLGEKLDRIVFISKQGMDYFEEKYPEVKSAKLALSYLGTFPLNTNTNRENRKEFSIVSCSNIIPRKRVDLIARAILELKFPVIWTHIGDGPEMGTIRKLAEIIERNGGKVNLVGNFSNQAVRNFYEQNFADLFFSTSDSEGLPVSMMEAQSAGIPILATDVGGVNEIVIDGVTGWLLPSNPEPDLVAEKIREFFKMKEVERNTIRGNAVIHWQTNFDATKNYPEFIILLKSN